MNLVQPSMFDLAYLCQHMRDDERDQWCALNNVQDYDADAAARQLAALPGISFALLGEGTLPLCAGGFVEVRPGVWQSWMVGSVEGWAKDWRAITKACRKVTDNLLASDRCHRIETICLASRELARRWYVKSLGETFEGVARGWFPDGRDAAWYAKVKE